MIFYEIHISIFDCIPININYVSKENILYCLNAFFSVISSKNSSNLSNFFEWNIKQYFYKIFLFYFMKLHYIIYYISIIKLIKLNTYI